MKNNKVFATLAIAVILLSSISACKKEDSIDKDKLANKKWYTTSPAGFASTSISNEFKSNGDYTVCVLSFTCDVTGTWSWSGDDNISFVGSATNPGTSTLNVISLTDTELKYKVTAATGTGAGNVGTTFELTTTP